MVTRQFAGYLSDFGQRSSTDFGQLGREPIKGIMGAGRHSSRSMVLRSSEKRCARHFPVKMLLWLDLTKPPHLVTLLTPTHHPMWKNNPAKSGSSRIIRDSSRQKLTYLEAAYPEVNRPLNAVLKPKIGTGIVPDSFAKWVENNSRLIGGR